MENELNNIIWGSRLFVNAQLVSRLLSLLVAYNNGECTLSYLFRYVHAIEEQKKVKLYKEFEVQLKEFIVLEELLRTGKVSLTDDSVISFTVNRMFWNFTKERMGKSD